MLLPFVSGRPSWTSKSAKWFPVKVVWQVTDCNLHFVNDKKEWKDTSVVWEASPANGATQVRMTHVGLVPDVECYDNCKTGWDFFVGESLSKLLNENKGLPDRQTVSR